VIQLDDLRSALSSADPYATLAALVRGELGTGQSTQAVSERLHAARF
jgi:hypothetical protein